MLRILKKLQIHYLFFNFTNHYSEKSHLLETYKSFMALANIFQFDTSNCKRFN